MPGIYPIYLQEFPKTQGVAFLFTATSTSTANFGIKIPLSPSLSIGNLGSNIGSNWCNNGCYAYSTVGQYPDVLSNTGYVYPHTSRNLWNISNDSNYIYFYTSDSSMKKLFMVGQSYWFCFQPIGQPTVDLYIPGTTTTQSLSTFQVQYYSTYGTCTVFDYNS
jgi:hypothetical protein